MGIVPAQGGTKRGESSKAIANPLADPLASQRRAWMR
jgi:hypothetical protein